MMKTNSTFEKIPEEETQRDSGHQGLHQEGVEVQVGGVPGGLPGPVKTEPTIIEEFALQQHMIQIKQQQYLQQQILEDQYQKNRQILQGQHDKQLQVFLQQMETQRKQKEVAMERKEQLRIETLRQKDEMCQSAVASPEVKRRLQEVILQRKRKEAAASMGNLRTGIPVSSAPVNPNSMLRKVQSESNLLKIKSKRPSHSSGPYPRILNNHLRLVPEASVVSSEDSTPSPISVPALPSALPASLKPTDSSSGSAPSSPSTAVTPSRPAPLGQSIINSRSLPNIPVTLDPARQSPPGISPTMRPPPHHRVVPVRRTLREHLMEKSMAERKSMDDNQYYQQQTRLERERLNQLSIIHSLEEVMEEDTGTNNHVNSIEDMFVDESRKVQSKDKPRNINAFVETLKYTQKIQKEFSTFGPDLQTEDC